MRPLIAGVLCFTIAAALSSCSLMKKGSTNSETNRSAKTADQPSPARSDARSETAPPPTQPGDLQPGQASGTYTDKGEVVALKYAYAGRAERFGSQSLVILLTENPIPADALAEEIKSTPLLERGKIRGLEYAIDDNGMWVRFHPSEFQESGNKKLKEYKVENDIVSGVDESDSSLSNEKYARSVKFVAAIAR